MNDNQDCSNTFAIKDPYNESEIKTQENLSAPHLEKIMKLYVMYPDLEKAIEESNIEYIYNYFLIFSHHIIKIDYDRDSPYDYVEFIFPCIISLIQINMQPNILNAVLLSLVQIVTSSCYYAIKIAESSAYQQLLEIIRSNLSDEITGLCVNIIVILCQYQGLEYLLESFPIQELYTNILSSDYGSYSKEGFFLLLSCYLKLITDDEEISQFFSYISQILTEKNLNTDVIIQFFCTISRYFEDDEEKEIDIIPEEIITFLLDNIINFIRNTPISDIDDIFYLIYRISLIKINLKLPIEELYNIILNKSIESKVKDLIITMMANSIKINDNIEYTKGFVTESICKVIDFCLEEGTFKTKTCSLYLIATIVIDHFLELFCSFLYSSTFDNFIDFLENVEDENAVFIGVGIIGNAFSQLQTVAPDSEEFQLFLSKIISSDLLDRLNILAEEHENHSDIYIQLISMFESESHRVSE